MPASSPLLRLRRWYSYRLARLSIPALLAGYDERKITALVTAFNGGLAILTLTALAFAAATQLRRSKFAESESSRLVAWVSRGCGDHSGAPTPANRLNRTACAVITTAPRSVILGHFTCISVGYATWQLVGIAAGEPVLMATGGWPVLASASIAIAVSAILLIRLDCPHAPGCASALIVAQPGAWGHSDPYRAGLAVRRAVSFSGTSKTDRANAHD